MDIENMDPDEVIMLDLRGRNLRTLPESIGNLRSLQKLYLSNNNLEHLPESIGNLRSLKTLDLSENSLQTLPDFIGNLRSLTLLDLTNNSLQTLPESIGNLHALERLYLNTNNLQTLPESIENLRALIELNLRRNNLQYLPESIGNLQDLRTLSLNRTNLQHLPDFIGNLRALKWLDLSANNLQTLPDFIGNLRSLTVLNLSNNNLETLPESIGDLQDLKDLDLSENELQTLPESMGNLHSLKQLRLVGIDLQHLPESIGNLRSLTVLNLKSNSLQILPESIENLHALERLDLSDNDLQHLPESIGNLRSLTVLNLESNSLQILPESMEDLHALELLRVNGNPMVDRYRGGVADLSPMELIDLFKGRDPKISAIEKAMRAKSKGITHRWQYECGRRKPNLNNLKSMFKRMLHGFALFHGEEIDPGRIDEYLETVSVRQLCKDFAVKLSEPIKTCHNDTTLLGDEWGSVDPLDVIIYKEGNISYCFTPEELLEIKKKNRRRNPYTQTEIPEGIFDYAQDQMDIMKLPVYAEGDEIEEEKVDPVDSVGGEIDSVLGTSHNGAVFSDMIRGANIPELATRTYDVRDRVTEAGGHINMYYPEYRLVQQNPSPEAYARWVLHIMSGNDQDTVIVFLFYLMELN